MGDQGDALQQYLAVARSNGVTITNVTPAALPGRGVGLVTTSPVAAGTLLINVPKTAMLSVSKSYTKSHHLHKASLQAQLASLLTDLSTSDNNESYAAYCRVWPTRDDFASSLLWWPPAVPTKELLPWSVLAVLQKVETEWARDSRSMLASRRQTSYTDPDAKSMDLYHWTVANTRVFAWNPSRGRPGIAMCRCLELVNHCESAKGCLVKPSDTGYNLVTDRDYRAGEEILFSYGAHDNDSLLVQYGFVLPASTDDSVSLDEAIIGRLSHGERDRLSNHGYLGGYVVDSTSQICFRTQVAVRSVLFELEWQHFMETGEDVGPDRSADVDQWLRLPFSVFEKKAAARKSELATTQSQDPLLLTKLGLVKERWSQIESAMTRWLDKHEWMNHQGNKTS